MSDSRYRHASGEDDGCVACFEDNFDSQSRDIPYQCRTPAPDPTEPGLCRWCSHTVEAAA
jgi:hypothetical protein